METSSMIEPKVRKTQGTAQGKAKEISQKQNRRKKLNWGGGNRGPTHRTRYLNCLLRPNGTPVMPVLRSRSTVKVLLQLARLPRTRSNHVQIIKIISKANEDQREKDWAKGLTHGLGQGSHLRPQLHFLCEEAAPLRRRAPGRRALAPPPRAKK